MFETRKPLDKGQARTWQTVFSSIRENFHIPGSSKNNHQLPVVTLLNQIGDFPSKTQNNFKALRHVAWLRKIVQPMKFLRDSAEDCNRSTLIVETHTSPHSSMYLDLPQDTDFLTHTSEDPVPRWVIEKSVRPSGTRTLQSLFTPCTRKRKFNYQVLVTTSNVMLENYDQYFSRCSDNRYRVRKPTFNSFLVSHHSGCLSLQSIQLPSPDFDVHLIVPLSLSSRAINLQSREKQDIAIAILSCHRSAITKQSSWFRDTLPSRENVITGNTDMADLIVFTAPPFSLNNLKIALYFLYHQPEWQDISASQCLQLVTGLAASDLDPFSLYRVGVILGIPSLINWTANKLIIEKMLHKSSAVSLLDSNKHSQLMQGNWKNLTTKETDIKDATLERAARQALVGGFGLGWCTSQFSSLPPNILESVLRDLLKMITPQNSIPLLFAAEEALRELDPPCHTMSATKRLLMTVRVTIEDIIVEEPDMCFNCPEWKEILRTCSLSKGPTAEIVAKFRWVSDAISRSIQSGLVSHGASPGYCLDDLLHSLAAFGLVDIDTNKFSLPDGDINVDGAIVPPSVSMVNSAISYCPRRYKDLIKTKPKGPSSWSQRPSPTNSTEALTESIPYSDSRASSLSDSTDYGFFYTRRGLSPSPSLHERPMPYFPKTTIPRVSRFLVSTQQSRQHASLRNPHKTSTNIGIKPNLLPIEDNGNSSIEASKLDFLDNRCNQSQSLPYCSTVLLGQNRISTSSILGNPIATRFSADLESIGFNSLSLCIHPSISRVQQSPPAYTRHVQQTYLQPNAYAVDPAVSRPLFGGEHPCEVISEDDVSENAPLYIDSKYMIKKEKVIPSIPDQLPPDYRVEDVDSEITDNSVRVLSPFRVDEIPHIGDIGMRKVRIDEQTLLEQENRRLKATVNMLEAALIQKDANLKLILDRLESYRKQARREQENPFTDHVNTLTLNGNASTFIEGPQQDLQAYSGFAEQFSEQTTDQGVTTFLGSNIQSNEAIMSGWEEVTEGVTNEFPTVIYEGDTTLVESEAVLQNTVNILDRIRLQSATRATQTSVIEHTNNHTGNRMIEPSSSFVQHHSNTDCFFEDPKGVSEPRSPSYRSISIQNIDVNKFEGKENPSLTFKELEDTCDPEATFVQSLEPKSQKPICNLEDEIGKLKEATKRMEQKLGITPPSISFFHPDHYERKNIRTQFHDTKILATQKAVEEGVMSSQLEELFSHLDRFENQLESYKDIWSKSALHLSREKELGGVDAKELRQERTYKPEELVGKLNSTIWRVKEESERLLRGSYHHDSSDNRTSPWNHLNEERHTEAQKCLDQALFNLLRRGTKKRTLAPLFTRWRDDTGGSGIETRYKNDHRRKRNNFSGRTW